MNLIHKVRILAGALAHKPFMPRPEKENLEEPAEEARVSNEPALEQKPEVADTERVADLIAQKQRRIQG
jgi:hypothetical protein